MNKENTNVETQDTTTVGQVDVDIDSIFGASPDATNVMLPTEEETEKPTNVLATEKPFDTEFIDKPAETKTETEEKPVSEETIAEQTEEAIAELDDLISQEEDAEGKGRPKLDKSGLADLASKMIDEGSLMPFDDDKSIDDYSAKDFRELFEANFQQREEKIRQDTPKEFFQALPQELQIAAKYVADGGTDMKGLFRTLSHVEEVRELDPSNEQHQAEIARQYLTATNFGDAEEIEEEIETWRDIEKLEKKANQFKPKLDKMQEEIVARQLAKQEEMKSQQENAAKAYMDDVYNTLSVGQLGDVKLDKKTQGLLYTGLVQPSYPSMSGKPTNLLGHLLEKYQYVEPRHDLIAEALWLLADPQGYRNKIQSQGSSEANKKTVRMLKTESSRKITSSVAPERKTTSRTTKRKTVPRKQNNIFKRF